MKQQIKQLLRRVFRKLGYDITHRVADPPRDKLIRDLDIDLVLDVGASVGQWAEGVLSHGYARRLVSFEPLSTAFGHLATNAARWPNWSAAHMALGDSSGELTLHVAQNSVSSSLLPMEQAHLDGAPESAYVSTETAQVCALDTLQDVLRDAARIYLKLDTQGYEDRVLAGAAEALHRVAIIDIEMSLVPLYSGQVLFGELLCWLEERGFDLYGLSQTFGDAQTGRLLQVDGLFVRRDLLKSK